MFELGPSQRAALARLLTAGFSLAQFPLYENVIGIVMGNCAALLKPSPDGTLCLAAEPSFMVENNLSVRVNRKGKNWFVWKKTELEATSGRQAELDSFTALLESLLQPVS